MMFIEKDAVIRAQSFCWWGPRTVVVSRRTVLGQGGGEAVAQITDNRKSRFRPQSDMQTGHYAWA